MYNVMEVMEQCPFRLYDESLIILLIISCDSD